MAAFEPRYGNTFTLALAKIAIRTVSRVVLALKNRRQVGSLAQLDERALKDIGLTRSDVHAALAEPFFHDPSVHLIDVAGYKRRNDTASGNISVQEMNRLRRPAPALTERSEIPAMKSAAC